MLKARVKYIGRRAYKNNYRYAEITTTAENTDKVSDILSHSGYSYSILFEGYETVFMVNVDNIEDYKIFMNGWKKAKKRIIVVTLEIT